MFARWAVALMALFLLGYSSAAILPAGNVRAQAQAAPPDVHVRNYVDGVCDNNDDTPGFQAAIDAWRAGQVSRSVNDLVIDAGCYQVFGTLWFTPWPGQVALFGNVRGAGPEHTVIQGVCGVGTMRVWDYKYGEFGGFKLSGRCGAGNQNRNTDLNHTGLMMGSAAPQMGTNGAHFYNITMEHYAVGLSVGDFWTSGSTAEMLFSNIGISQSHIGVMLAGFNTLDNKFDVLNVAETDVGVYSDTAYTTEFHSGSGSNNATTFYLAACCEWLIDEWREEYGGNSQYWIQYASPASDNRLTIIGANTVDTFNPHRAFAESVHPLTNGGSNTSLIVLNSLLNGAVGGKKVTVIGSAFTNGRALSMQPASLLVAGSCLAEINAGQCATDLPNELSGEPDFPAFINRRVASTQPTATPVPATPAPTSTAVPSATAAATATMTRTAVPPTATPVPTAVVQQTLAARWDAVGTLWPTTRNALATVPITVTNVGSATWTPGATRVSYWWIDAAGAIVLYGDLMAIPRSVAPGQSLVMDEQIVTPGPGVYRLHLVLMQSPGNWFDGGRDLQVTIT